MNEPMSPDQIAEKARSVAAQMDPGAGRSALEGFAEWIDEQERKRIEARDNVRLRDGTVVTRGTVYDLSIRVHKYGGGEKTATLRGWAFDSRTGYAQSYLNFHKAADPERPWAGARREINIEDILSAVPA